MPACCCWRGEVQNHLRLHQFSSRRCRCACCLSHRFNSFCAGHLLVAYVCSTGPGVFSLSAIHMCFKHHCLDLTCERGSVGQSEGLPIPRSSVRFRLKPDTSNSHEFELHRPSNKGTKLLLKVIKAIIIIMCM